MKAGWELKKLQQVSAIVNGGTPDTKVPEYWDGDNLWITPKDMGKLSGRFVDDTFRKLTLTGLKNSSAKILPPNSLILSSRAPIGHLAINSKPISSNQGCKGLIPSDNLDTFYLYYFLLNSVEYLNSLGTGTTFKELSGSKLGQVEIPLPPLPEQQRIVSILDEAFAAIEKAKANAEKNLKNAKELFVSYLQGVFENKGDSWEERKLQDITEFDSPITYGVVKPGIEGEVKFVRGGDLQKGRILVNQLRTISLDISNQYKRTLLKGGELLICLVGMPGQTAVAPIELKGANIARQVGLIRLEKEYSAEFYNYYFQSKQGIEKLGLEESGAVQRVINLAALRNISVPVISPSEQHRIVQNLEAFSSETKRLESIYRQKLSDLEELKKSILQKAFNGELNTADICA